MAREISDVTQLTEADALAQWRSISDRRLPSPSKRQVDFVPVEDILCYGLFRLVAPNAFGKNNIHDVPDEVKRLASALRRPTSSLIAKMCNLAYLRPNGQRADAAVYLALESEPELARRLGESVIRAARLSGLGEAEVPNLWRPGLGVDQTDPIGQDEIGEAEVRLALSEQEGKTRAKAGQSWPLDERQTERIVELRVRQNQRIFAGRVLENFRHRCAFCGMTSPRGASRTLLRASHIKPWCESESKERLDVRNGIAACPNHDAAFDQGLLVVNGGLRIHPARSLRTWLEGDPAAHAAFGPNSVRERLELPQGAVPPDPRYLDYHRQRWHALHAS